MKFKRIIVILIVSIITMNMVDAQKQQYKTAAITECTMLDHSLVYNNDNTRAAGIFELLAREQERSLLDTIISQLSRRYSISEIKIFQKDSIAFSNTSMKGIGKFRETDRQLLNGNSYDYYIKIYSDYTLSAAMISGLNIKNTAQAKITLYIAVFDAAGKRIWFPDAVVKDGIGLGGKADLNNYYDSNKERAEAYLSFFNKAIAKIFNY